MEALQRKLNYSKKQTAFAWAKYYEETASNHERNITHYETNASILSDGNADEMPSHIVAEIEKMTAELKKSVECPICLDVIAVLI